MTFSLKIYNSYILKLDYQGKKKKQEPKWKNREHSLRRE